MTKTPKVKHKGRNIITSSLAKALDRAKVSDRNAVHLIAATANNFGHDILSWLCMIAMRIFLGPTPIAACVDAGIGKFKESLLDHEGKLIHPVLQYPAQCNKNEGKNDPKTY